MITASESMTDLSYLAIDAAIHHARGGTAVLPFSNFRNLITLNRRSFVINGVTAGMPLQRSGKEASVDGINSNQHFLQRIRADTDNRPRILAENSLLKNAGDSHDHPSGRISEWSDSARSSRIPHPRHLEGRTN